MDVFETVEVSVSKSLNLVVAKLVVEIDIIIIIIIIDIIFITSSWLDGLADEVRIILVNIKDITIEQMLLCDGPWIISMGIVKYH